MHDPIDAQNASTYNLPSAIAAYAGDRWLPAEVLLFADYAAAHVEADVLDLACGSGRLASVLASKAKHYVGVDYSAGMIAEFQRRHPLLECRKGDIRSFLDVAPGPFDVIWLSFNGIDSIPYGDRTSVYHQVRNALRVGGYFIFSTHNLGYVPLVDRTIRPPTCCAFCRLRSTVRQQLNRRTLRKLESHTSHYAIVNDRALEFGLLNVYPDPDVELQQLRRYGFEVHQLRDAEGVLVPANGSPLISLPTPWIYVAARRVT